MIDGHARKKESGGMSDDLCTRKLMHYAFEMIRLNCKAGDGPSPDLPKRQGRWMLTGFPVWDYPGAANEKAGMAVDMTAPLKNSAHTDVSLWDIGHGEQAGLCMQDKP